MTPKTMQRITLMVTALSKVKEPIITNFPNQAAKFFDFDDDELWDRAGDIIDKEEITTDELLEIAAIFFILYLKDEHESEMEAQHG